jgi:acyl-CoA thioesterase I
VAVMPVVWRAAGRVPYLCTTAKLKKRAGTGGETCKEAFYGTDVEGLSRAEIEVAVQYHHPEKTLAGLPAQPETSDELLAPFFGTDARTYQEIKAVFAERARRCARELLQDARFVRLVDQLPFEPGTTVLGLGDSITDDYQSWFEILRHLLVERRPDYEIRTVNSGVSGDTTSRLLGRFLDVLDEDPAWILLLIGTNDVPFVREPLTKSLVSREETAKNLRALRDLATTRSNARLVWITPPPAIEDRITEETSFAEPVWRNVDLADVARLVREVAGEEPLIDLWKVFGTPAEPEFLLPDGLHPSLTGQKAIAAAVVEQLSRA